MTMPARVRRVIPFVALVSSLLGSAIAPPAVVGHSPDPVFSGPVWVQDQGLTFHWRAGSEPPASLKSAIQAGAADSNATRASRAATFAYVAGGVSPIGYGAGATCGVGGLACFNRSDPAGGFTMWFREQGHRFDWGSLRWCQMYDVAPNGCFDAETVALDEFGHVEILNHHANYADDRDYLDAVVQTVSRTKPNAGWNMHSYGRCDVATLQMRYDMQNSSARYSTCLALNTVVMLSASPTTIASGGTTRLSALLKVAGVDAYGRLRGNPISNRAVTLQRRAPGTSAWSTVATMTAGATAGTYATSVRLYSRTEFRAVFSTPTGEGLVGSSSAVATVSMSCTTPPCPLSAPAS